MVATRFAEHLLDGDHASRPAAGDVPEGTLYSCSTHSLVYQSDGASWATWASLTGSGLTDHTHAATGSGGTGGGATLNPVTMKLPAAMGTTAGQVDWDTSLYTAEVYDSQRERAMSHVGWAVRANPVVWDTTAALTTALTLAAAGGSLAIPMEVPSHMLFEDVGIRNVNVASARTWGWDLYLQDLNDGNSGENTVRRVAACSANDTFTPGAASSRFLTAGAVTYLAPGVYWLVVQNRHATNGFDLGSTAVGVFATNSAQTKTTTNPNGATIDLVAATWTKVTAVYGVQLRGRVLGQTTLF